MYNFDEIIDRKNTNAVKLDRCKALFGTDDLIPLWVADMDFRTPKFILDAIRMRLDHPVLGYTLAPENFISSTQKWITEHHNWELQSEWLGFIPGIVPALSFAVQSMTQAGDEIIVQPPVYYPFFNVIRNNHRIIVYNQLNESEGKFKIDIDDFESKISNKTKLFILCNPHNPGGRVWTKEELVQIATVCEKHNLLVISDEIHADMVLPNNTPHTPFASISDWAQNNSLTFMAPSKVFNMPGLISSAYIIPNNDLRHQFTEFLEASEVSSGNIFAYIGAIAAYEYGEEWRKEMLQYVQNNIDFIADFLKTNIPQIVPMIPEASFLVWLDCEKLGFENDELHQFFSFKAKLGLNKGSVFGSGGEQHLRMNVASPRSVIKQAMKQLKEAVDNIKINED
jgi:cystathionine beta-lyase